MLKKLFTSLLCLSFLNGICVASENTRLNNAIKKHRSSENDDNRLAHYAVLANQAPVSDGNIPWAPQISTISKGINVNSSGFITLKPGLYLIEYTVRLTKSPFDGTATATVLLQQTVSYSSTNIAQSAITTNTSVDGVSSCEPTSQTQITGYALIKVTKLSNNTINLVVSISGDNLSIPAASGTDANAEMVILQLR